MGEPSSRPDAAARQATILIVEDEVLLRLSLADDLIAEGYRVIQAASADEAMKVLNSAIEIDLVISDIEMPGAMSGLGLAERVRAAWPGLKVILVSGHVRQGAAEKADLFLPKPYSAEAIAASVRALLGEETP